MELQGERPFDLRERIARKWVVALAILVVAIGIPVGWYGPRFYSQWQQNRLFQRAQQHLEHSEVASAVISLRRVLLINPDQLQAARKIAELAETYFPSEAPALRERVCQIAPTSYPDATAWALAALRVGQTEQAEEAFALMQKLGKPTAQHYEIGARIALAAGRVAAARDGFARVLELDPTNEAGQFEMARIDIRSPDPALQQAARETLDRLRANPTLRSAALRSLIGDRIARTKISEAWALARELVSHPEATFQDRLQFLDILRSEDHPGFAFSTALAESQPFSLGVGESRTTSFASYLSELQAMASKDAGSAAALLSFMNARGLALLAAEWATGLPPELTSTPPVAPLLADSYRLALDWPQLEKFIADANWGYLEFMRCAFAARVLREKGEYATSVTQWAAAVKLTDFRQERLFELARMAGSWGWANEREEVLWVCARNLKRPREALQELALIARGKGDSQALLTIWTRLLEIDPTDVTVKKNWVRISLLLGNERFKAGTMAQELYRAHPEDPEIATSYALVLHHRMQSAEALAVMERIPPEKLREPTIAGYYGVLLFANKRNAEAAEALARAADTPFLHEEQELMDKTRRLLDIKAPRR